MLCLNLLFLFFLVIVNICDGAQKKPASNYFQICNEKDQKRLDECIKSSVIKAKPLLAKGIPEIDVSPTEPLSVERIELIEGQGNFKMKQILTNLKVYGLGDYEIKDLRSNLKNLTFFTVLFNKKIRFEGDYEMDGQILILPVKGHGQVTYEFDNVTTKFETTLEKYTKGKIVYVRVKKATLSISPQKGHSNFTNLFNGDKALGDATNRFLNQNWKEAFETFKHLPEEAFSEVLKSLTNNVYKNFPFKELFPSAE